MEEPEHRNGVFFGKGKMKKSCSNRKIEGLQEETASNGIGKSVFGRWLKDFRSSSALQNRPEPVPPQRPVGRTLSANYKDKDRKKKISRTMSASQKDRRKDVRKMDREDVEGPYDWTSGIYEIIKYKTHAGDGFNGYSKDSWSNGEDYRKESFSNSRLDHFSIQKINNSEINRSALVSYLDEEGLKEDFRDVDPKQKSGEEPRHVVDIQDGVIMPASSLRKKSTGTNHYENHNSILLNERNKAKNLENGRHVPENDCPRISYPPYKPETGKATFNYYNDHRYENLETTDYISWSSEKDDKFGFGASEGETEVDGNRVGSKQDESSRKKIEENDHETSSKSLECDFRFGFPGSGDWCRGSQNVPEAPARDPSSLKSIKYGPGHEKYPSWPGSIRAETGDKPQRSHSWTEKTNYPKEKVTSYARPHNKRPNTAFTQQLKTVMERCEKITPESYQKTMEQVDEREKRLYLPRLDREGNSIGDQDYMVPSPPERDKPSLTQADLDKYYQDNHMTKIHDNGDYSTPYDDLRKAPHLTQADLEEYARSYEDVLKPLHQHQGSYAQSEGYHSYVSSSELTTTPFLDRLRRDSDTGIRNGHHWSEEDGRAGRDSVVTTSSGSASSSETLKWHGSMSDVSVASSSCRSRQLIAHSSRVPPPQRHHSESVLYLGNQSNSGNWSLKGDRSQQLKLFPVNTYTVQPNEQSKPVISPTSVPKMSVAERISELEKQQNAQRFAYYDPEKRHKVSDPTLKAIQKKALLSFYERHQQHSTTGLTNGILMHSKMPENWKSEQQQLTSPQKIGSQTATVQEIPQKGVAVAPPPPPRPATSRRSSCASDMSLGSSWTKPNHSYSCSLVGPAIIGPSISVDDWVPELPPKKPHLKSIPPPLPQRSPSPVQVPSTDSKLDSIHYHKSLPSFNRMPTPDLPPPPPPPVVEDETVPFDEPLPPPPPEVEWHLATAVPRRSTPMSSGRASPISPNLPVKDSSDADSSVVTIEHNENARPLLIPDAYEIQYDQNAINAIMESNRLAEMQKKKHSSKGKHGSGKDGEEKSPLKVHIENRPPLPLPRDVQLANDRKSEGCDRGTWQKSKENQSDVKVPFVRSFSKPENANRASMKSSKTDVNHRSSLRHPSKKGIVYGKTKERQSLDVTINGFPDKSTTLKAKGTIEYAKPFTVKKVSEYECRIPTRDRDGLTVFETTAIDDTRQTGLQASKGSNSKAAFLALRREKEMSMTNCEGSYKLTVSPSGERIESGKGEKFPLEMMKMKEKSTENLVLDNRLSLEPPDLIPKIGNLNRKSSSAQEVRDNRKKYDYNCYNGTNEKYRLIPASGTNGRITGMFSENIIQNECKVSFAGNNENKTRDAFEGSERIPMTTVECVRAVITKLEAEPQERLDQARKEIIYQSREDDLDEEKSKKIREPEPVNDKYGVSISLSRTAESPETGGNREKTPTLLRVRSNVEKRLTRSDSVKSNGGGESKGIERSKSLKLVERSTSFGKSDTIKVIGVIERSETRNGNLSTSDASSQTDLLEEEPVRDEATLRKMEEDLECERLSRDLASQLPPSDKLQSLLVPDSERKKPTDYVANLFRLELSSKPRRKSSNFVKTPEKMESNPNEKSPSSSPGLVHLNGLSSNEDDNTNVRCSSATLLNGSELQSKSNNKMSDSGPIDKDPSQLQKKKEELMTKLGKKLVVLKEEQEALTNESTANEELGIIVANNVAKSTRPHDLAKYRLHVEEVGKITSLLLGLSGRLAKVENALLGLPSHHDDRKTHESKRDKLQEQLAEAKQLKENIDRRSDSVAKTLGKHLNPDEYADYVHFIRMKAKLIVDLREIGDKISLGEEQLAALKETTLSS